MRHRTTSGHFVGEEFPNLFKKTMFISLLIRRINESDITLTPAEQAKAIKILPGLPAHKMESLIPVSGPVLSDSIRKIISKGRATTRTTKRKYQKKKKQKRKHKR